MKKLQKLLALSLVAVMTVSLAACGNDNSKTTTESTTQATTQATTKATTTAATTEATTEAVEVDPFEGMEITVFSQMDLTAGGNTDSWYFAGIFHHALDEWCEEHNATWTQMLSNDTNVLMSAIAAGKAPDLYYSYQQWPLIANLGLVQPISDYYEEFGEKYGAEYLDIMTYQDECYGINLPWNEMTLIRYNNSLFERLGVKTPKEYFQEDNWTWETLREVIQNISKDTDGDGVKDIAAIGGYQMTSCMAPSVAVGEDGRLTSLVNSERSYDLYQMLYEEFSLNKTINKANGGVGENVDGAAFTQVAMTISAVDIYEPSGSMSMYNVDANGDEWICVPVPEWKQDDEDYFTKINFFQMAVPSGAQSLEASMSVMDAILEAGCVIKMQNSGMTDYEFTGLKGTTEESKAYIEYHKNLRAEAEKTRDAMATYDADYTKQVIDYIAGTKRMIEYSFQGVTYALTNGADQAFWTTPAATALAELYKTHQAACDTYNGKYIFD